MTQVTDAGGDSQTWSSPELLTRLSVMMFLQYFIQGSYLPIVSVYVQDALGFSATEMGFFGAALSVGPIVAPFVLGHLVDRMFATERVMAFCHLVGGLLMLGLYFETRTWPVILLALVYSVLYVPTMMLSNSLAFQHLRNQDYEFPWIRAFGTLGFIVPLYVVELWWLRGLVGAEMDQRRGVVFAFAGVTGILMALYCLTLPHTPPRGKKRDYAPGVIIGMIGQRHFLVLILVSFLIAIAHKFFFVWNSPFLRAILDSGQIEGAYEGIISSIGQVFELAVMTVLGFAIKRYGFKWTLIAGASAYTLRCILFSLVFSLDPAFSGKLLMALAGQALHGFCFGCFLAAGYMYVDRVAPGDVRGSMQTMYGTFVIALGFLVGGVISGWIGDYYLIGGEGAEAVRDWTKIWFTCAVIAAMGVVLLVLFFPARVAEPIKGKPA